jgi:hypothetical protein
MCAEQKGVSVDSVHAKVEAIGEAGTSGTTKTVDVGSGVTDRLTDTAHYGGTHKSRFDADGHGTLVCADPVLWSEFAAFASLPVPKSCFPLSTVRTGDNPLTLSPA